MGFKAHPNQITFIQKNVLWLSIVLLVKLKTYLLDQSHRFLGLSFLWVISFVFLSLSYVYNNNIMRVTIWGIFIWVSSRSFFMLCFVYSNMLFVGRLPKISILRLECKEMKDVNMTIATFVFLSYSRVTVLMAFDILLIIESNLFLRVCNES